MTNDKQNSYFIPGAIVIAGLFIAGAIFYSTGQGPQRVAEPKVNVAPEERIVDMDDIDIEGWPSKGDSNAPVLIVEYSDIACPFCARFSQQTLPSIEETYIDTGKVHFVYKDFTVVGGDRAAEAAHCAAEQGKFWEYHDLLFVKQAEDRGAWSNSDIHKGYAEELGLNADDLVGCFEDRRYKNKVLSSTQEGKKFGITGTPAFIINGELVVGALPFNNFQQIIERELANL